MTFAEFNPEVFWNELPKALSCVAQNESLGFGYVDGVLKTASFDSCVADTMPPNFKKLIQLTREKFHNYDTTIFCSLSSTKGLNWHYDAENIVIMCIYGKAKYELQGEDICPDFPEAGCEVTLEPGQTLFIPNGIEHRGLCDSLPRITLSMGTNKELHELSVDFDHESLLRNAK